MRLHRFYVSQPLGEEVVINDVSLGNQWMNVFRYSIGDFVILFNGDGYDYTYSLLSLSKKSCSLIRTKQSSYYGKKRALTLCLSLIKKDLFELAVQKATELGVTRIIPIVSTHSQIKNISHERLQKIVIEASEQCGRGDIPIIAATTDLHTTLYELTDTEYPVLLQMGGTPLYDVHTKKGGKEVVLFIGPEGGWSKEDITLMKDMGIPNYSLGETVLRAETAAIVAVAVLNL